MRAQHVESFLPYLLIPSLCILSMRMCLSDRCIVFLSNVNYIIKNYSIRNLKMGRGKLRQFTSLKWNSIENISKVHMQDHTDFGLFSKFRRPNQNLSNLDAIFVSEYDVTTASFSHYV